MNEQPHVNVDILILKDGKILLGMPSKKWLQGEEKMWGLPGNDIQFGETIQAAVERNMGELFDSHHSSMTILGAHENFAFGNHYIGIGCIVRVDEEIDLQKPSEDWQEWEWCKIDDLPKNMFVAARKTVEEYKKSFPS